MPSIHRPETVFYRRICWIVSLTFFKSISTERRISNWYGSCSFLLAVGFLLHFQRNEDPVFSETVGPRLRDKLTEVFKNTHSDYLNIIQFIDAPPRFPEARVVQGGMLRVAWRVTRAVVTWTPPTHTPHERKSHANSLLRILTRV